MKRSQRFSTCFSFEEEQQTPSKNAGGEKEILPKNFTVKQEVELDLRNEYERMGKKDSACTTNQPRSAFFRPPDLWLTMMKCLSLRWLSSTRQSDRKLEYKMDLGLSEDTDSSLSSVLTNGSPSSSTSSDNINSSSKHEVKDVRRKVVKSAPFSSRGISRSSPRLPRTRQPTDTKLASIMLEKEMFLRVELVDSGNEGDDLRYRAEWKLSETTNELAVGVWLSQSQK